MSTIPGKITRRLLDAFGRDSDGWDPPRPGEHELPPAGQPIPPGVHGQALGRGADRTLRAKLE